MQDIQSRAFIGRNGVRSTSQPETTIAMLPDELNMTLADALHGMTEVRKASLLLDAALDLIDRGR